MRNLLNPRWLIFLNTIPAGFLLVTYIGFYTLVQSQLSAANVQYWYGFMGSLLTMGLIHLTYAVIQLRKRQVLDLWYGAAVVITYPVFIYIYWQIANEIFPSGIPSWMIPEDLPFYLSMAFMPTIVHGIYVLVISFTQKTTKTKAWHNLLYAGSVPVGWYLFFQIILPLWNGPESGFTEHLMIILMVLSTVLFLFFVMRMALIFTRNNRTKGKSFSQTWIVIFGIIFPVLGLLVNNGELPFSSDRIGNNVFGDFTSPWYLIIVIINGLALFFSEIRNPRLRLALFVAKSTSLTYVLYFFLIFLPYLPLSVLLIIIFGLGLLLLSPLILLIIQGRSLLDDFDYLRSYYPIKELRILFVTGILLLPAIITFTYWQDRQVLHKAMTYAFEDDRQSSIEAICLNSLKRTLSNLKTHKSGATLFGSNKPILTPYYTWLVLDNMTLSEYKIALLEEVFFGTTQSSFDGRGTPFSRRNQRLKVETSKVVSQYQEEGYWLSTVELQITNQSKQGLSEYVGSFELPEGTWIKDYYLDIEGRREHGILAEKKAATWLYQQIVRGQRDPGILYYLQGRKVAFRIFPFTPSQTRVTGIELIHKEAIDFHLGDLSIKLGEERLPLPSEGVLSTHHGHYLSKTVKSELPVANRTPYFHFLVDCSVGNEKRLADYLEQAQNIIKNNGFALNTTKISYINSSVTTADFSNSTTYKPKFEGGFFLEKAMKQALTGHFSDDGSSFPLFVVLSNDLASAVFTNNLADYAFCSPETDKFFSMGPNGKLNRHSFINNPLGSLEGDFSLKAQFSPSLKWADQQGQTYFITDNGHATIVPDKSISRESGLLLTENWLSALDMQAQWQRYRLGTDDPQRHWLQLIKSSFQSQIMNPTTSFMALENESQKELLRRKQEQVLSGKSSFDLGDDVQRMSEPDWWILLIALGLILWFKKFRS